MAEKEADLLRRLLVPDWEDLERRAANPRTPMRKGSKHKPESLEKMRASQLAKHARRREALAKAIQREVAPLWETIKKKRRGLTGLTDEERILCAMEPLAWYARPDVVQMTNLPVAIVKGATLRMWRLGDLNRAQNPEWVEPSPTGMTVRVPQWLFTLSPKGEARRAVALMLL